MTETAEGLEGLKTQYGFTSAAKEDQNFEVNSE
jgi:hypothetical protein